jgi:hypothetical protein
MATTVSILVENRLSGGAHPDRTIHVSTDGTLHNFADALKLEDPSFSGPLLATHITLETFGYTIHVKGSQPGSQQGVNVGFGTPEQVNSLDTSNAIDIATWTVTANKA